MLRTCAEPKRAGSHGSPLGPLPSQRASSRYFTIRSGDHEDEDERCAVLQDVGAALDYARHLVRELSVSGCNDPGLAVSVRNETREIVLSVPFLAACA
jgi:hypothetical protein